MFGQSFFDHDVRYEIHTGYNYMYVTSLGINLIIHQERPLGKPKNPPSNKLPSVTFRLKSSTTVNYMCHIEMSNHSQQE